MLLRQHQLFFLLLLFPMLLGTPALAICPPMCSCSRGHRTVDCSGRSLGQLPDGLQHNIRALNLSHNRLHNLDGQLSHLAHLRSLDISHNLLALLPAELPRALWEIQASGNLLRHLEKNDTAYHWNLRILDLSANALERVVFINNTMPALQHLNLSHNKFWTVPTNMPAALEVVDLSHNFLVQILPGSLDRLSHLSHFYLHSNRFSTVDEQDFAHMPGLQLITLYDNPWACEDEDSMAGLLAWMDRTPARVQGCPCSTRHICGEAYLYPSATTNGGWRFASYTHPPLAADARDISRPPMQAITSVYLSQSVPQDPSHGLPSTGTPTTTQLSTTSRPRNNKKAKASTPRSTCRGLGDLLSHMVAMVTPFLTLLLAL